MFFFNFCAIFLKILISESQRFFSPVLIQSTQIFQWYFVSIRIMFSMKLFFPLAAFFNWKSIFPYFQGNFRKQISNQAAYLPKLSLNKWSQTDYSRKVNAKVYLLPDCCTFLLRKLCIYIYDLFKITNISLLFRSLINIHNYNNKYVLYIKKYNL